MSVTIFQHRITMSGEEPFYPESCKTIKRPFQCISVPSREVIPSEASVREYGVSRDQRLLFLKVEADTSRRMTGCVQDAKRSDPITFFEKTTGKDAG
jgi:hypothetical protein